MLHMKRATEYFCYSRKNSEIFLKYVLTLCLFYCVEGEVKSNMSSLSGYCVIRKLLRRNGYRYFGERKNFCGRIRLC